MFPSLFLESLFFFFPVLLISLQKLRYIDIDGLYFFGLRFFRANIFDNCFLSQYLYGGIIRRAIIFEVIDIQVLGHNTRLLTYFGLFINSSLHHLLKAHKILVLLLYFDCNERLELFLEIINYN